MTALSCARALVANWIAQFGVPAHISSDKGAKFTSGLWAAVGNQLGTKDHHTAAYHPQANGLVEHYYPHLKLAFDARLQGPNWLDELPWVLLGIQTAPKEGLNTSSAELIYGSPLNRPYFPPSTFGQGSKVSHQSLLHDMALPWFSPKASSVLQGLHDIPPTSPLIWRVDIIFNFMEEKEN